MIYITNYKQYIKTLFYLQKSMNKWKAKLSVYTNVIIYNKNLNYQ